MIKKAIIPAAGYGTRNLPITKVVPKEMFPINNKPAIHYIVEEAVLSGIEEILIIVSRNKNMILDYFDRSLELERFLELAKKESLLEKIDIPNVQIQFVRQPYAKGLGAAIKLGERFVGDEPFAVLLPDDLYITKNSVALKQLINVYEKKQGNVLGLQKVESKELKNYGVIKERKISKRLFEVIDIIEKPQSNPPSNIAVAGRYILEPEIFSYLEKETIGAGGEIQLTDAIKSMLEDYKCYGRVINGERFDLGKAKEYLDIVLRMSE